MHGIALKRSNITKLADLNGKNVGLGPRGGTPGTYWPLFFQPLNIRPAGIRFGSGSDMAGQVQDGLLDAFLFASGVPVPAFSELETQQDANFIDLTEEEVRILTAAFLELSAGQLPATTYRKAGRPLNIVGMFNFAICHHSLPEDLVHEMVKAVLTQNPRLKQAIAAGAETLPENARKNTFLPFHPGAARFLRSVGQTIPDNLVMA